jgi:hypothetical protein
MCDGLGQPTTVTDALGIHHRALDRLNTADAASLPSTVQAEVLRRYARLRLPCEADGRGAQPGSPPAAQPDAARHGRGRSVGAWRAAQLRAGLHGPLASVSLPLDVGPATETIAAHLRRAVTTPHPHWAFPGCAQPASVCEIHHIIPRSRGGPTSLDNLLTMCTYHHKIVIHRWAVAVRAGGGGGPGPV